MQSIEMKEAVLAMFQATHGQFKHPVAVCFKNRQGDDEFVSIMERKDVLQLFGQTPKLKKFLRTEPYPVLSSVISSDAGFARLRQLGSRIDC